MEDNRLILNFMGIKPKSVIPDIYYWNDSPFFYISEDTPEKVMDGIVGYSKYHESWDWLMPVINKISKLNLYENIFWVAVCHRYIDTPISVCYESVVEFIKWYNKNK